MCTEKITTVNSAAKKSPPNQPSIAIYTLSTLHGSNNILYLNTEAISSAKYINTVEHTLPELY